MPTVAQDKPTGFPFGYSRNDFRTALQFRETRDLLSELESWQWFALDLANDLSNRDYIELQTTALVEELERRQKLLDRGKGDPFRPRWPTDIEAIRARVVAVKARWPMEQFCRELLLMDLTPAGNGRLKGRCPMAGHDDKTPSFVLYPDGGAWCHGCQRGGDVIKVAQFALNLERFIDALRRLEQAGGLQ